MSATAEKPVRRFPPPCWTQDEALALVEAYRDRWYALRRGYLRTSDWDAVAEAVGQICPGANPPKTSAQCRHKMEKLRQRYRAEKQRSLSFPAGRFFSTWFYFEAMDAMEMGPNGEGSALLDSGMKVSNLKNNNSNANGSLNLNPGRGIRFKPVGDRSLVTVANNSSKGHLKSDPNYDYGSYLDAESDKEQDDDDGEFEDDYLVQAPIDDNVGYRGQEIGKINKSSSQTYAPSGGNVGGGFRMKPITYQDSDGSGLRPRKFSKVDPKLNPNFWDGGNGEEDDGDEVWVKVPRGRNLVDPGFRGKYSGRNERNSNPNLDTSGMNGFSSHGKKSGGEGGGGGAKRENGAVADMVSSIRLLGDGFMKMEKMKMEMAREIEKMRMEMEMKRNELILESQKQIVDAFVKGLVGSKKPTPKPTMAAES